MKLCTGKIYETGNQDYCSGCKMKIIKSDPVVVTGKVPYYAYCLTCMQQRQVIELDEVNVN